VPLLCLVHCGRPFADSAYEVILALVKNFRNGSLTVLDKLHGETVRVLAIPAVRNKFDELGLEPVGNTPAEFAATIRKETPEWAKVIKDAGIRLGN
jgi:Tripartite tricarboxylate transporter family receptor